MKIDITRTSPYDNYSREMSLLDLFSNGHITLEELTEALDENSTLPKADLESIVRRRKEARQQIMQMQEQANALDSAIQQEMIMQGGDINAMSQMPIGGDASRESGEQQVLPQM